MSQVKPFIMSVNKQPGALDARAAQGLGATGVYTVSQGGFLKEALTDGCCENKCVTCHALCLCTTARSKQVT